jgi:hypothetical protein
LVKLAKSASPRPPELGEAERFLLMPMSLIDFPQNLRFGQIR